MHGHIGSGRFPKGMQDCGRGTHSRQFRMEEPDAGGRKFHVLMF